MNNANQTESLPAPAGSEPLSKLAHELYAHERSFGTAITIAAERAGLSRRSGAGSKLEADPKVKARIAFLAAQEKAVWDEKRKRIEERQWLWHDVDVAKFYEDVEEPWLDGKGNAVVEPLMGGDGNVVKNDLGEVIMRPVMRLRQRLRSFSDMPLEHRMCVESLTFTDSGKPNLKLYSKADANRELRKINGIDKAPSLDDSDPAMKLNDKDFFAELARQANDLGIDIRMTFEVDGRDYADAG